MPPSGSWTPPRRAARPTRSPWLTRDMPDVGGYELARAIRGRPALNGIQLVLLSPSGSRSSSSDHTFDAVLTKPVRQSRLYEEIQTLIAGDPSGVASKYRRRSPPLEAQARQA